ncbi:MAG TPA: purine-nucleoside phosphorylase [Gemmatimonadaceae bacterium]|jgi:purine-nucleoside phosphorylase
MTGAERAAAALRERIGPRAPAVAIVLGSGLDSFAARIANPMTVPYAEIPGFHATTVAGHRGELIAGTVAGRDVVALAGRFHLYEGHDASTAAYPVRVVRALGAKTLFVSNAAGGIRRSFAPGDLMIIEDHLNFMFRNPLLGAVQSGDQRFPDMSAAWSPRLVALLKESARAAGTPVQSGVYAGLLGPAYETPAEVRMLATLGADAVGMSTVPEVIVATAMGMEVAGISLITNAAAGISGEPLSHTEVVQAGVEAGERFAAVVEEFLARV